MVAGKERKYYMLSGKGGVGKTSCAVSLVVRFANHGHPTMIVSTDPAHSLSDYFAQENVLAESRMMIPDCHKRLEAALVDLKGALAELEKSNEKEGSEIDDA
ncbi:ATPase GET3B isoform X5 [Arachis hypogaea]|uniref:ATPase GET3B isoform X5 n=1 Tax=Arachis hypogaea TaxID=3818 RepID=UPI003B210695